jgi:hypothetical protein
MSRRLKGWCLQIMLTVTAITPAVRAQTVVPDLLSTSSPNAGSTWAANAVPVTQTEKSLGDYALLLGDDPQNRLVKPFLHHLAADQENFWARPARLQTKDLKWIVPFAGFTGGLIAGDSWISKQVPDKRNQLTRSQHVSNYALYSLVGAAGGSFLLGRVTNNDHLGEAGLLSGEAAVNSTAVAYLFKTITQRPRPLEDGRNGTFFQGGSSFPSEHSAVAWSVASVWAHEYPGPLSKLIAYGLASTVTLTRVTGKQHFPSDAVIGSALGWYFGRQVYRAHHDPELGGAAWGNFLEEEGEHTRNPDNMASPYVTMDSWIYPALDRLIALGYVQSAMLGIRPWTRMECARMLEEAGDRLSNSDSPDQAAGIYHELSQEFVEESARLNGARNVGATVESVYTRVMNISRPPLRDGYHFGQTIINDYGRPFGEGVNLVTGTSGRAVAGPFSFYVRGEYQQAPSVGPVSPSALQAMAGADFLSDFGPNFMPSGFSANTGSYNRFRLLEGSISLNLHNVEFSFGKQNAWLGPGEAGPLLFSDNAEPITMLRIDSISPFHFPLVSNLLGPARTEFFIGQLSGLQWVFQPPTLYGPNNVNPQPFVHGDKISFKPTPNLEFGMGIVAMFGGPGLPFTIHNFLRTYYSHRANLANNPGKRFSAFDFSYRVPRLRKWLTAYLDSLVVDEVSPIGSSRPSLNPGLYMPQVPKIPKLEIRAEGLKTAHPGAGGCCVPGNTYFDSRYISGFTNNGDLIANWIGRAGWGGQAWATYNFSPRTMVQFGYRSQHVDRQFVGGGGLSDFTLKTNVTLRHDMTLSGMLQYEHWNFPVLAPTGQSNFTASLQVTYWPRWSLR